MGRSRRMPCSKAWISCACALIVGVACPVNASGAERVDGFAPTLQLAVSINGVDQEMIGAFGVSGSGALEATRGELADLGIKVPGQGPPGEIITLNLIPGLVFSYDQVGQSLSLAVPDSLRIEKHFDAQARTRAVLSPASAGLVVNYSGFAGSRYENQRQQVKFDGASAMLDARAYSAVGVVSQSGVVGTSIGGPPALRLDTAWSYSDENKLRTYRAGDVLSGSLSWTRPVRLGGGQVQRNFALRPDLVTMPLPTAKGNAAVPSTVDIYVNNIKTYSTTVGSGPFSVDNVPATSGAGDTRVVVTDVTGRKTEQSSGFFTAPELLRKGLIDYSLEAGLVRRSYGLSSFDYGGDPAVSATLRYGLSDRLTGELHGEVASNVANGGIGGFVPLGGAFGMVNGAVAASASGNGFGVHLYGGWHGQYGDLSAMASMSRSYGNFDDLASVNTIVAPGQSAYGDNLYPPALDQISIGYHLTGLRADVRLGAVHYQKPGGQHSYVASADVAKAIGPAITVYANGFLDDDGHYGATLGAAIPLGRQSQIFGSAQLVDDKPNFRIEAQRAIDDTPGSYGWRIARSQGRDPASLSGSAAYRSSRAQVQVGAFAQQHDTALHAEADGALVIADGGLFFGNTISDAFAVVDAGAPAVPVRLENRDIGTTGRNGKLLVPGLNAYQQSKLSLDVTRLPVTAVVPSTELSLAPRDRSGVVADFGIRRTSSSAIVILTDAQGNALPAGTPVTLEGSDEAGFVGYDGRTFFTSLKGHNRITANTGVACTGDFAYTPQGDAQQVIGPVPCL
jgi:outer membrane usher protein